MIITLTRLLKRINRILIDKYHRIERESLISSWDCCRVFIKKKQKVILTVISPCRGYFRLRAIKERANRPETWETDWMGKDLRIFISLSLSCWKMILCWRFGHSRFIYFYRQTQFEFYEAFNPYSKHDLNVDEPIVTKEPVKPLWNSQQVHPS